ncbi:SEN1 N terminal-domain-containing protein [Gloeopeniophorella convolvens]|nr:SEN1 N terminal-domain-containing protein [Gloeopeniophorella convolvens]
MSEVLDYLFKVPTDPSDGAFHWFCQRADPTTREAASFLLRLLAYDSQRVNDWKVRMKGMLRSCCDCVKGLQEAKEASRTTYLAAFPPKTIQDFVDHFSSWEIGLCVEALTERQLSPDAANLTLLDAPPALIYLILSNLNVLQDSWILSIIAKYVPSAGPPRWPVDPPPPGLFYMLLHENPDVRRWSEQQVKHCQRTPMPTDSFVGPYVTVLEVVVDVLAANPPGGSSTSGFPFTQDPASLWSGLTNIIRLLPSEYLKASRRSHVDLRRVIAGHLHDRGSHFIDILRCYVLLLRRLNADLWANENSDYPQVVFDAVKDNPCFSDLIRASYANNSQLWLLRWFSNYLHSIWTSQIFNDVLGKMVDFLCEELQHERFQDTRPAIMLAAAEFLQSVLQKCEKENTPAQRSAVLRSLDIHIDRFASISYLRTYGGPEWASARVSIRSLISRTLEMDIRNVSTAVAQLSLATQRQDVGITVPNVRKQTWTKVFSTVQPNDSDAVASIISIIAQFAHLNPLNKNAFAPALSKKDTKAKAAFEEINGALKLLWTGCSDVISKYANYTSSSTIASLLRRAGIAKDITILMLCPSEDLQSAAQTLVGQAFDADIRSDCFRAMLQNLSGESLQGILAFMETFVQYAVDAPEACDISKSLVRCLTDVIEVLCSSPDSLLLDDEFLGSEGGAGLRSGLPKLWTLMTNAISIIFSRTPLWSVFFDAADMIAWMRDALIFGRDMLAQWKTFETAAIAASASQVSQKPSVNKLSRIGKRMVNDLQQFLPELAKWLRLTDEELLHQSFALLQSLLECFKATGVPPSEVGVQKLARHIENSRKKGSKTQTKLDTTRILQLEASLAAFEEDDEDVEIVSRPAPAPKRPPPEKKPIAAEKAASSRRASVLDAKPPALSKALSAQPKDTHPSRFFTAKDREKLAKEVAPPRPLPSSSLPSKPVAKSSKSARGSSPTDKHSSSSEESSSDEGSNREGGLAKLGKSQRTPRIKKPAERRQMKMLDLPANVKMPSLQRSREYDEARRRALRMKPDISGLHRTILSWSYDYAGPDPPSNDFKGPRAYVSDRFADYADYQRVFEPLLLLECWAQIVQSKEETVEFYESKITSRRFVDDFVDLDMAIAEPLKKGWFLSETDIILLRQPGGGPSVMGKVTNFKANASPQQSVAPGTMAGLQHAVQVSARCYFGKLGDPGLNIGSTWQLSKVFSLSTLHREYAALMAMPHYDCADLILKPRLPQLPRVEERDLQQTMSKYNVNQPQARAIVSAMRTDGFSLIQGPPGTGKTSTICGLVQAFLSSRPQIIATAGSRSTEKTISKKILLCAPSNAAIDEIAGRLKDGVSGAGKRSVVPKVVRIGAEKAMNINVKDISLDSLVDQKLDANQSARGGSRDSTSEIALLRSELDTVRQLRQAKQDELAAIHDNAAKIQALDEEVKKLNYRRVTIIQKLDRLRDQQKSDNRTLDATRRRFRMEVLAEADVICSTLSGSGHDVLETLEFDMIIIDEAAQAIELSSLIPLKYNVARCIMVGDPQQLPPTVISQEATRYLYNQSLFVRLQKLHPEAVHLLSIQYRMHPDISKLPSRIFYKGLLQDGEGMAKKTARPWHESDMFGPYRFFNITRGQETTGPFHSLLNKAEVQVAVSLYARILNEFSSVDFNFRVGVVSMYRAQIVELRRAFEARFGQDVTSQVDFNTVDGFQGQEKDIIILSCVRAGPGLQTVGFLADVRRMNVALTRARASLFVLGHCPTLERSDKTWRDIVSDARERGCLVDADVNYFTAPKTQNTQPKPAPKASKKAVVPSPAIPNDLVAARDIGTPSTTTATSSKNPDAMSPTKPTSTSVPSDLVPLRKPSLSSQSLPMRPAAPLISPKSTTAKSSVAKPSQAENGSSGASAAPNGSGPSKVQKPRPPPAASRPKQAPSLFIPRKVQFDRTASSIVMLTSSS